MSKRTRAAIETEQPYTPNKRRATPRSTRVHDVEQESIPLASPKLKSILKATPSRSKRDLDATPDAKVQYTSPELTVQKSPAHVNGIAARNDQSAREKSAATLQKTNLIADGEGSDADPTDTALARSILSDEEPEDSASDEDEDEDEAQAEPGAGDDTGPAIPLEPSTPAKRPRGRPKGRRKERTPTPPPDLPAHELYFFHNRTTASQTSTNVLLAHSLLNHEDYLAQIKAYNDHHEADIKRLMQLHHRSFEQWQFELDQRYSLCLYGMGSKRNLIMEFVDHIYLSGSKKPQILVVNGYNVSIGIKDILNLVASSIFDDNTRLPGQPIPLLDAIARQLNRTAEARIFLVIHNLDSVSLRKTSVQAVIARLASLPQICLLASCDSLNFGLMWDLSLLRQFNFVYHDATTFEPWTAEIDAVEEVNRLLGRSSRRLIGKDGVGYVLRSLPENARNLFRILVAEQLALGDIDFTSHLNGNLGDLDDDDDFLGASDEDIAAGQQDTPSKRGRGRTKKPKPTKQAKVTSIIEGVEYRTLYHKAVEEFVCSSEVNFRTLLKEFHDHQMIESRKDAMGTERLIVPFRKEELEAILEEL